MDQCIWRIWQTEQIFFPWNWNPVTMESSKAAVNSINADISVLYISKNPQDGSRRDKNYASCIEYKIMIPGCLPLVVLDRCRGIGLMTIDTHCNIPESPKFLICAKSNVCYIWKPFSCTISIWQLSGFIYQSFVEISIASFPPAFQFCSTMNHPGWSRMQIRCRARHLKTNVRLAPSGLRNQCAMTGKQDY